MTLANKLLMNFAANNASPGALIPSATPVDTRSKWEIEREEKIAAEEIQRNKAREVMKALGATLDEKSEHTVEGTLPTGESFYISCFGGSYGDKGKFQVRGNYSYDPRDCGAIEYEESRPEIGVSRSKTVEQIAKDIQRRFLPKFLEVEAICKAYKDKKTSRIATRDAALSEIAEYVGTTYHKPDWRDSSGTESVGFSHVANLRGKAESFDGENFTLELRGLSLEQVKKILDLAKGQ